MAEQTLGQMVVRLGLDSSAFGSGLAGAKKAAQSAMSEMKADMKIAAATGNEIDTLAQKQKGLMKEVQAQAKVMREAQEAYNGSFTDGKASASTAQYAKELNNAAGKMAEFQRQSVKAAGQQAMIKVKTTGVTGAINTMGKKMSSASKTLRSFGSSATWGVTVPIVTAFAAASKQAMEFQNKLITIKNLLVTSGESGATAMSAVSKMQKQAVTLSDHYGVSVNKISQGYEDLVRRGYSGAQAVGAMKTMLQGALASGDDFNDVVKVASETMESFGMRLDKNGKQLQSSAAISKRTKVAVNELAYAADATATDFNSLGLGMSYVGSSAHQAGFSLAETSAAMGVLSNNGLSAQKAGTGLRKVVISLTTAVGKIDSKNSVLAKLGIKKSELVDSTGSLRDMDTVFAVLAKHTQGMSTTEKGTVFNSLFGTTGQQAGIILTNNASALGDLTKQVEKASKTSYVSALSEKNLASAQNQMKVFMETVKNLGMVLADSVLPAITPVMGDIADMAKKFANLSPQMQQTIVKFVALAAAIGPLSSGLGMVSGVLGKTSTSVVGMIGNVVKWRAEVGEAARISGVAGQALSGIEAATAGSSAALEAGGRTASKTAGFWGGLAKTLGKTAPAATTAGVALESTGAGAGVAVESGVALAGVLGTVGLALGAVGLAVAGGAVWWNVWGKKQAESAQRTKEWGSDIGSTADKTAGKIKDFEADASLALSDTSKSASTNGKTIEKAFSGMASAAEKSAKKQSDAARKIAKDIGGAAGAAINRDQDKTDAQNQKSITKIQSYYQQVEAITKQARDKNVALTADQKVQIQNLQESMAAESVKTMGLSAKQQKQVLKALNGDIGKISTDSLSKFVEAEQAQITKAKTARDKNLAEIKKGHDDGVLSDQQYADARRAIMNKFATDEQSNLIAEVKMNEEWSERNGRSRKLAMQDERDYLTEILGLSKAQADAIMTIAFQQQQAADSTVLNVSKMTGATKTAAESWNSMVFDPKTGKVKTNAVEEVQKGLKSEKTWNQMELLLKKGKMTTNAKQVMLEAVIANNQWYKLTFEEKKMLAKTNTAKTLMQALQDTGTWDKLKPKTQQLIAKAKTKTALNDVLKDIGVWKKLKPGDKELLGKAKTASAVKSALKDIGVWKKLDPKIKNLIAKDYASSNAKKAYNAVKDFASVAKTYVAKVRVEYSQTGRQGATRALENQANSLYRAKGDSDFQGGPAIVNDQPGSMFREGIFTEDGITIPEGRNVLIPNIPKHATILTATMMKRLFPNLPQFSGGLNIPANADTVIKAKAITRNLSGNHGANTGDNSELIKTQIAQTDTMIQLLTKLLAKDSDVYMNATKVGQLVASTVKKANDAANLAANRRMGVIS